MSVVSGRKRAYEEISEDHKEAQPEPVADKENQIQQQAAQQPQEQIFSKHLLQIYYDRLFPYQDMFHWLSYFNDPENTSSSCINAKFWRNREFSFTLKDDIYVRYQSYRNLQQFKDDLRKRCPYKIDIGALYNIEPCRRSTISSDKFIAEEKELVFDIDISDYDDVRTCCSEANICNKCWLLMVCAIKVMQSVLSRDFGLRHLLWVFSGRRGIHCWCSDDLVRKFDVQQRSAMIDYLKLYTGNSMNKYKVHMNIEKTKDIHDSLQRSFEICLPYFIECSLKLQRVLDTQEGIQYFVDMIRFPSVAKQVQVALEEMVDDVDYQEKWNCVERIFDAAIKSVKGNDHRGNEAGVSRIGLRANLMELVFAYVYPRLDVEVSRHVNHLLKSPFCIHPKTGKVCSIIDPRCCEEFDPLNQPTLLSLIKEYNEAGKAKQEQQSNATKIGWKDTSLKQVVKTFRECFLN
eukprot:CAMPEP_0197046508 /NCGR_PEP_ID=MMETSP1384-20130603/22218_1 /TAXON_ID=29189 /ORGANISM="Ammonia sp." /LENGTH=460 /DNA_ID=CAMNT_0042478323 /DNA_START=86 /DNA_END=1465 /DNA_ORIENTATION=-